MPSEIEVKVPLADPHAFLRRLRAIGGRLEHRTRERNVLYDFADRRLSKKLWLLRLRTSVPTRAAKITLKGPQASRVRHVMHHEEVEFEVSDAKAADAFLRTLGTRPWWMYEGKRARYRLQGAEISVDEMPRLGWFAEIEATNAKEVERLARLLGFSKRDFIAKSYRRLAAEHFKEKGLSWCDLVF